jgi:hypothetical protein
VNAVSAGVYADKTIDTLAVRQLEYEDCQWVFEGGMPMPDYDLTEFEDGSWHSGAEPYCIKYETSGQDLQSFFDYLAEKGLVKRSQET